MASQSTMQAEAGAPRKRTAADAELDDGREADDMDGGDARAHAGPGGGYQMREAARAFRRFRCVEAEEGGGATGGLGLGPPLLLRGYGEDAEEAWERGRRSQTPEAEDVLASPGTMSTHTLEGEGEGGEAGYDGGVEDEVEDAVVGGLRLPSLRVILEERERRRLEGVLHRHAHTGALPPFVLPGRWQWRYCGMHRWLEGTAGAVGGQEGEGRGVVPTAANERCIADERCECAECAVRTEEEMREVRRRYYENEAAETW